MKEEISKILYKHDPVWLGKSGAPEDEYDAEAELIEDCLNLDANSENWTVERLRDEIYEVFYTMFCNNANIIGEKERYQKIAEDIHTLLRSKQ